MFTFCIQTDTIKVEPRDFGKDPVEAIKEEIHRRYANKVLPNVGLVISLMDILSTTEGAVLFGDGCFYYKTVFRLIMFRPFIGEAFLGKVVSSSPSGLTVSVGFFDDILVPFALLPDGCYFDPVRQRFFWAPPEDGAKPIPHSTALLTIAPDDRMYVENKEWLKLRVVEERFEDTEENMGKLIVKAIPGALVAAVAPGTGGAAMAIASALKSPYSITAAMNEPGLGCLDWWEEEDEEEEEE